MINVRPFRLDDVPWIAQQQMLLNEFARRSWDSLFFEPADDAEEQFSSYISRRVDDGDFYLFVAEVGGQRVGYCMGWIETRPPIYKHRKVAYFSNRYVSDEHRGMGIGDSLHMSSLEWAQQRAVDFIQVHPDVRNVRVIQSHEKEGFQQLTVTLCKTCIERQET